MLIKREPKLEAVSPVIDNDQIGNCVHLTWAKSWPMYRTTALHVNHDEKTGGIIMRFRLTWRQRLAILFGQNIFAWFFAYEDRPQWPHLFVCNPRIRENGQVLPFTETLFDQGLGYGRACGGVVDNPLSNGKMSEKLEPSLEEQLNRTIPEKLIELAGELPERSPDSHAI